MSSASTNLTVGVILCSSRQPRVCPQVASFVTETLQNWTDSTVQKAQDASHIKFDLIDLATWNLPFFNEPTIPSRIKNHADYVQPHTRAWSQEIQKYTAFIFVLPQYNWGYPAIIKNAIDYLFHEWNGKPAIIVSYGGHGGTKAAAQLREVLHGVDMKVTDTMPALSFPSRQTLVNATKGEEIHALGENGIWAAERGNVTKAFEELLALLSPG